jgi:hypothetical protein
MRCKPSRYAAILAPEISCEITSDTQVYYYKTCLLPGRALAKRAGTFQYCAFDYAPRKMFFVKNCQPFIQFHGPYPMMFRISFKKRDENEFSPIIQVNLP